MENIFYQLAFVLLAASAIGVSTKKLRLPLVISYLLSGLLLSFVRLFDVGHSPVFEVFPEMGIAFVLFLIGIELKLSELRYLGKPVILVALGQIFITTALGYGLARLLNFNQTESLYMGLGLAFSSTVVVVKMLLDNRDLTSLYGKLSVGILLVEDLVAVVVLMLISLSDMFLETGQNILLPIASFLIKALILFGATFVLAKYLLNKIFEFTAHSVELLYVSSIAWCFSFTSFAVFLGFSLEIGAFLAGVSLATSPYHLQIQAKIKPMRDFFLALFFIYLGAKAEFKNFLVVFPAVLVFTIYALIAKPLIYAFLLSRFGFKRHTFFQTALSLSQISEFSLVVLMVGISSNIVGVEIMSIMALVAIISITLSSVLISFSRDLYKILSPYISSVELKNKPHIFEQKTKKELNDHVIVIGGHRVGGPIIEFLKNSKIPFVVLDFNPSIVKELQNKEVNAFYGDIGDPDIYDFLHLEKSKLIICTATDFSDNQLLLNFVKEKSPKTTVVLRAADQRHAEILKQLGANYVILPEKVSGDFVVSQLKRTWPNVNFNDIHSQK